METAKVVDPDKIVCELTFSMSLGDWKQIRKTLNSNKTYAEMQLLNEISDLVFQLEKTYYANVPKRDEG